MKRKMIFARLAWLLAVAFGVALVPCLARAVDGSQVVSGGGEISFTGASETNWVVNADGSADFLIVYTNTTTAGSFKFPGTTKARILAVGGGGGGAGGFYRATSPFGGNGGGGSGGLVTTNALFEAGDFSVVVGKGGAGGSKITNLSIDASGNSGGETVIRRDANSWITAYGGGGGGSIKVGKDGGSGGGGSQDYATSTARSGGSGTPGQGNAGGPGDKALFGGGGGGAGAEGSAASASGGGKGGDGVIDNITGNDVWYAGGGAGSYIGTVSGTAAVGGQGGGGAGGYGTAVAPIAGTDGLGGGGGGGCSASSFAGAKGGSGIVIVRISGAISGGLEKPTDKVFQYDGENHTSYLPSPFYAVEGISTTNAIGVYPVTVTPNEGISWTDGSSDAVSVTMTIYAEGGKSGTEKVSGCDIKYVGAADVTRVGDDLLIKFTEAGTFTLPGTTKARILAIGGGGGGAGGFYRATSPFGGSGGGGAGGLMRTNGIFSAATFAVQVGCGGAGGIRVTNPAVDATGKTGGDTILLMNARNWGFTACGGGGGGSIKIGKDGGSGGGGSQDYANSTARSGGSGTPGQGNAGGAGDTALFGGGGGGAGAAGAAASASGGGKGGDGVIDNITGEDVWYAGGGAGGYIGTESGTAAAGGQGGGGAGGYGTTVAPIAGTDGLGGGGGGGCSASTFAGAKGGSGVVYVRISATMEGELKKPETTQNVTFDGNAHTTAVSCVFYDVTGENIATNVGTYKSTVTLKEGASWPGGDTQSPINITMTISPVSVAMSGLSLADWTYGAGQTGQAESEKVPDPTCTISPTWVKPIYEYALTKDKDDPMAWSTEKPTLAGDYTVRVRTPDTENYTGTTSLESTFKILKREVTFTNLSIRDWMLGTPEAETPNPSCAVTPSWVTPVYTYGTQTVASAWIWSDEKPTTLGTHKLRAALADLENLELTSASVTEVDFKIVKGLGNIFTDYVEITVAYDGTDPETLENFPFKVQLSESDPVGFLYERVGKNGEGMAFTDAEGNSVYPYEVETWKTNGTSTVYVKLPLVTATPQTIRLYWHVRYGASAPSHDPDSVWANWTEEEYAKLAKLPGQSFDSPVYRDGYLVNYWTTNPQMSSTFWDSTDSADKYGKVTQKAVARFENEKVREIITNLVTGATYDILPTTEAGNYRVSYVLDDPERIYVAMETHVDFTIIGHNPWGDLKGDAKTLTLSGRVMLANDDVVEGHAVSDQGYWQTREVDIGGGKKKEFDVFWTHEGEHGTNDNTPHFMDGRNHTLCYVDESEKTNVLWRLEDVMFGNVFYTSGGLMSGYAELPRAATSLNGSSYEKREVPAGETDAMHIVMCNTTLATVYSPCYTNGIGTIYFDALNGQTIDKVTGKYRIVVEVASATDDGLEPTDENATGGEGTLGKITGDRWVAQTMLPLKKDNNATTFTAEDPTNDFDLAIQKRQTTNNFYRICVPVNCRKASRFRIRRVSANEDYSKDSSHLLLLDNIIVSYPQMGAEVAAFGRFDENRMGNRKLGQEGAMMQPFPSLTDGSIVGRGKAVTYVNASTNANPDGFIGLTRLHYRWHYLEQDSNDWATVDLTPGNGFVATESLQVPRREGDVEWWYESFLNMPYYEYFDYSGTDANLKGADGKPLYTEEVTAVTNRCDNWFFRYRRGKSEFESVRIYTRTTDEAGTAQIDWSDMELVRDGVWRGYVRTEEVLENGLDVRFEMLNRQTAGGEEFVTNTVAYRVNAEADEAGLVHVAATGSLVPASAESWTTVSCDATTGYLLFQIEEKTLGISILHADYQNFNKWSDANRVDAKFVGTSTDTNSFSMSGSSEVTREFRAPLDAWHLSIATNDLWSESFKTDVKQMQTGGTYELFKPFSTFPAGSPNGFTVGPGQWVSGYYREANELAGMALQMEGCGKGYIQFVNAAASPRGIESISLRARLGQFIEFDDFSYYDGADKAQMTNYTFMTRAAFDLKQNTTFSGNGSLSLVAFYRPSQSCYEFRVEQYNAAYQSGKVTGPGITKRLSLYRWRYDDTSGEVQATLLGSYDLAKDAALKTNGESGNYGLLFISARNNVAKDYTEICAGVSTGTATRGNTSSTTCRWIYFIDSDTNLRLKNGTYGVLSANCPGRFVSLMWNRKNAQTLPSTKAGFQTTEKTFNFPGTTDRLYCQADIYNDAWAIRPRRATVGSIDSQANCCIVARQPVQPLVISTATKGTTNWKTLMTTNINNFGAIETPIVVKLWSKEECSIQIAPGGSADTVRNDIVVDDIEIRQWLGESYDDAEGQKYFSNVTYGSPTNFVFTQGWNLTGADGATNCQLNAKRSLSTVATSIRSPLMDGQTEIVGDVTYKRGSGLGMFTFSYTNAQKNAKLLLQICTNGIDSTSLPTLSKSVKAGDWTTVTNYDFSTFTDAERAGGTLAYYLGLHGVTGVMRLAVDPDVVTAVADETDPDLFGSIDITSVLCRDEPKLDRFSWWGWNLRTTNDKLLMNVSDVERTETENGLAGGLNNSVTADIVEADRAEYPKHLPFVQTPTFDSEVVGEVSFKARKYAASDPATRVTLFGAKNGTTEDETSWKKLASWTVDNATFSACNEGGTNYTYKTSPGDSYCAFRFAVTGVEGVTNPMTDRDAPAAPQRVLLDEILVQEAIRGQVAFRNVAAFRSQLDTLWAITNIMDRSEQPLCQEAWGVQAEVYASQLAEEVDLSNAKVRLWWYESDYPWGFEKWRDKAQKAWLSACEETNLVYRSSYFGSTGSVMSPQTKACTVQYMLEVIYKTAAGEPVTNWLSKTDWVKPAWYDPLDFNADYGDADGVFSAYTILDTVAPGWAWINEVNIFDAFDSGWRNSDRYRQFIEIASPSDADLSGWKVRILDAQIGSQRIVTNDIATFGATLPGLKKDLKGLDLESGCVFHVVAAPQVLSHSPSYLDASKGEVDGYWSTPENRCENIGYYTGEFDASYPVTIQLVRPSGIIEHQIVALGTNEYPTVSEYQPENHAAYIEANQRSTREVVVVGSDDRGSEKNEAHGWSRALGVFAGSGDSAILWNNTNTMTPGAKNAGQVIDSNCPRPNGSSIVVYAVLGDTHLEQNVGGLGQTNATVTILCKKGGLGTNIVYTVAPWYQLGTLTTNSVVTYATETNLTARTYTIEVARGASNDVRVVASTEIDENLVKNHGLTADNRYLEAIMKWLNDGCDLYGNAWANPGSGVICPAEYWPYSGNPDAVRTLSLTEMYWLDIDPTEGNWIFKAGFVEPTRPVYDAEGEQNVRMSVFMMISNKNENAAWTTDTPHKLAHAPYALRGLEPDSSSQDYSLTSPDPWVSTTFKITGFMDNGLTQIANPTNWVPLRWFGFHDGSFYPRGHAREFQSTIDVRDPYSTSSPAYSYGYYQWVKDHGTKPMVYYGWSIDERLKPITVDILTPDSTY